MRLPKMNEVLSVALGLTFIGWIIYYKKLNSPELHALEDHYAVQPASLSEKYFPRHQSHEDTECLTLVNNGFYDVFLTFLAFEVSKKHGNRMIGSQNAMIFPVAKNEGPLSAAYQFCINKQMKDSHILINIIHFEAHRGDTTMTSAGTPVNASAFCLCPPQTTEAIQNEVKRKLFAEKCKGYNLFFHNSRPGSFCDPQAGKQNNQHLVQSPPKINAMNSEGYPLGSDPSDFGRSFSIYNNGIKDIYLEVDAYSPEKRVISEVASSIDVGLENHYYIPFDENNATFEVRAGSLLATNLKKGERCLCDNNNDDFRCKNNDALLNRVNIIGKADLELMYKEYCNTSFGLFSPSVIRSSSTSFSLRRGANIN